jgi:hypothetical protein
MKWVVVNSLRLMSSKHPCLKVPSQSIKFYLYFFLFNFISNLSLILESLLNYATLLARVPNASFLGIERFVISSPSDEFLNNSINVQYEDVLYN